MRSGSQSAFQVITELLESIEVRALCRPVHFFHTKLGKTFLYPPGFMHRGQCHVDTGKNLLWTVATKLEAKFFVTQFFLKSKGYLSTHVTGCDFNVDMSYELINQRDFSFFYCFIWRKYPVFHKKEGTQAKCCPHTSGHKALKSFQSVIW